MPFCSQCGNQVGARDLFCGRCGNRQPVTAPPQSGADLTGGIRPRTASVLCYIPGLGWIASIIVLASERFRHNRQVRFHAFQGLYLFVAWLIADWVVDPMFSRVPHFHLGGIMKLVLLGMSIFMIIKASREEAYALPVFGELAERSLAEE